VAYDAPAAGAANAVVFPGRGDAIITLARLHARGAAADAWFWPEVAGGWRADASPGERWMLLLEATHCGPEAAAVAAGVIGQAVGADAEDELLSSIPPGHGARWLRLEGWSSLTADATPPIWRPATDRLGETFRRWRRTWGSTDDRLVWLSTLMTVLERPACLGDPRLPARVAFALTAFERTGPPHQDPLSSVLAASDRPQVAGECKREASERAPSPPSGVRPGIDSDQGATSVDLPRRAEKGGDTFERVMVTARPAESQAEREPQRIEVEACVHVSHVFTPFAGLLFVVPILERLEFAAFLGLHPRLLDDGFPSRLLGFIGQRVGLPPDDPLALAARAESVDQDGPVMFATEDLALDLPACVRDVLSSPKPRTPLDSPVMAWLTAVRRWCRRHARMGLATLIRRPGQVRISRTHIDACFALSQVDVRVRRLALDVDPGWVPWIGRVVQFRYGDHHAG
jgi:hypothetical protein